uniref:IS3 family transposase n=1 Tax=Aliarcobacter sp. TaxID=2321116 RepID=UPI0040487060
MKFCIDNSDKSISSIAKDLGLNKGTLSLWVNEYKQKHNINPSNELKKETLEEENKRLRKELVLVKQEREILKKAAAYFAKETPIKYAWIKKHSQSFSIKLMCKLFKVSRSCYYNWIEKGCVVNKIDKKFNNLIKTIFEQARATYGTRRLKEVLKQKYGLIVSRRKIQKSLKQLNLKVKMKRRFKVITTTSNHTLPIAPNHVNRDFYSSSTDKIYVGDITYIPTKEGWLYLAVVIDIYSRKVVGWSMRYSLHTSLVNDALLMAIKRRNPNKGLIYHTDRGSQYASYEHKDLLEKYGIVQSMSKKGDCWDNAVAESFFHSLKTELIHHENFLTRNQANEKIFEYIEIFYNRQRLHSSNNYMSPSDFEEKMLRLEMVS